MRQLEHLPKHLRPFQAPGLERFPQSRLRQLLRQRQLQRPRRLPTMKEAPRDQPMQLDNCNHIDINL